MQSSQLTHRILYHAMLDMRAHARESGDNVTFQLCDLLHPVLLHLSEAALGEASYEQVWLDLQSRAAKRGDWAKWLQHQLAELQQEPS